MGSNFEITVVAKNENIANNFINDAINEIIRIEKLISSWDKNSQTSEINSNAGLKPVKIDYELFHLIERSIHISKMTDGAFDISFASIDKIWDFNKKMSKIPSEEDIKKSIEKIGYQNIILKKQDTTVYLAKKGMKIGFGAIGKGYAADKAKKLLQNKGVKSGIINASGDINAWGKQPNGAYWMVAITNPLNKMKAYSWLPVKNSAVVTSGNYEKFITLDGIKFSHIINPLTGYPVKGIVSVTVFANSAELADALATSVFVMGVNVGLNFINQLEGIECIIVDDKNDLHTSKNIELNRITK